MATHDLSDEQEAPAAPCNEARRGLQTATLGLLFFVLPINVYVDAVGWALLGVAAGRTAGGGRRKRMVRLAVAGFVVSAGRILAFQLFGAEVPWLFTALYTGSLALLAGFVWLLGDAVAALAGSVDSARIEQQARMRSRLYVLYPLAPLATAVAAGFLPDGAPRLVVSGLCLVGAAVLTMLMVSVTGSAARMCASAKHAGS